MNGQWTDEKCGYPNICPKPEPDEDGNIDYPIFFATMQEPTVNNQKEKIYVTENYVAWTNYSYAIKDRKLESTTHEQKTAWQTTDFIQDLFIEDYGDLNSHKKWISKPVVFEKKTLNKKDAQDTELVALKEKISLD